MKASETHLQEIIEGTKQYIIPMFQRTYSWKDKQWNQLWEDIIDLVDDDQNQSHFIGSIVSIPINASTHGIQQFLVIDGQQRLTTLLILLAAMRDVAKAQGNEGLSNEIHNTLLVNTYKSGEEFYKFLPTQVDKKYFKKVVNIDTLTGLEESLIIKAYEFFFKKIEIRDDISVLKSIVTAKLSIVSIVLSPDDNPYLVFESLNAKGQPLTQSDLIRNHVFMRIPPEEQENQYLLYWLPMQEKLGDQLTEFIRHYLGGVNINVRKNEVYVKFKEKVDGQDIIAFLKILAKFADYYNKLLNPSLEENIKVRKCLQRINDFDARTAYPFLLYIYRDFKQQKYTTDQFIEILKIIENYLVRRFVCNIESKSLNKTFYALYNQVSMQDAEQSIEEIISYLQNRGYPKDPEFSTSLKMNHFYGPSERRKKGAYILKAIEESFSHKEPADLSVASIEHIMPQTLTEIWLNELGVNAESVHSTYLHTLGNLTLTGYNSELSNEPFVVKKKYLKKSNYQINKGISSYDEWNQESIEKRADDLINIVLKVWPYFGKEKNELRKITGSVPRRLTILNQFYSVSSWREVMEKTILTIYDNDKQRYQKIMDKYPDIIADKDMNMRKAKLISTGHYMEVNLNAQSIYNICINIWSVAGYSQEEWQVEIEKR